MTTETQTAAFIDSNIWLYAFITGQDPVKHQQAKQLLANISTLVLSSQVVNEVCATMIRKEKRTESDIRDFIDDFYTLYTVIDVDQSQIVTASWIRERYGLSFWDGIIVASALRSRVPILYSEDMHNGLIIEQQLTIINPFQQNA
jgi:predicted nucleic acid-binding protein